MPGHEAIHSTKEEKLYKIKSHHIEVELTTMHLYTCPMFLSLLYFLKQILKVCEYT